MTLYFRGMKSFLNASEVARLLNVDRATVSRWIRKGLIKGAVRPTTSQSWRIPLSSYQELTQTKPNESHHL
jgi:excisionase family DNA binding protein